MQTRIQKGSSLVVRIPESFAEQANFQQGTLVDVTIEEGKLVIAAVNPTWTLEQLLSEITSQNIHSADEMGSSVGREVW